MKKSTIATGVSSHAMARFFMYGTILLSFPLQLASLLVFSSLLLDMYVHYQATMLLVEG